MRPRFFRDLEELRAWFEDHGTTEHELWIGYYKKGSGRHSLEYDEVVDEALAVGWIDGQVRRVDEVSYANRFTPRTPTSAWSLTNIRRARRLIRDGRMRAAGLRAFQGRTRPGASESSSVRVPETALDRPTQERFASAPIARAYFESQPPGYQRLMIRWIMSARRPATRARRARAVILASQAGRRVDPLKPFGPALARRESPAATVSAARETS